MSERRVEAILPLRDRVLSGAVSVGETTERALAALRETGRRLGAVLSLNETWSLEEAERVQERIAAGERPPLAGIPLALKDNICTEGWATTCASRMLADFVPPYSATVVERLREAGAVIVAKTNMDEFGMGSTTENSAAFPCLNPWDPTRSPGGSSGGSAALVAAGVLPAALGSDTGGSVRQPAALCGCVGLKPTYGRVSRYGLVAFASSLDQIGPMARSVSEAALLLEVIAGRDEKDATSSTEPLRMWPAESRASGSGLRLGLPREAFSEDVDADLAAEVRALAARLEEAGAQVVDVTLPHMAHALATYFVIAASEASSNLARYDGVHLGRRSPRAGTIEEVHALSRGEGFGREVVRRILLGTWCLSRGHARDLYERALRVRTLIRRDYEAAFARVDLLLSPTTPAPALLLGAHRDDPLSMYRADMLTVGANLAGLPALSVPGGFLEGDGSRLPFGVQLQAPAFREDLLFRAGSLIESLRPERDLVPPSEESRP